MFHFLAGWQRRRRAVTLILACAFACVLAGPACALPRQLEKFSVPGKGIVTVFEGGLMQIEDQKHHVVSRRLRPGYEGIGGARVPDQAEIVRQLLETHDSPYVPGSLIVVYRDGVSLSADTFEVKPEQLARMRTAQALNSSAADARYTSDYALNHTLSALGVARQQRLFAHVNTTLLSGAYYRRAQSIGAAPLNPANAVRLVLSASTVNGAVAALLKMPGVAYASPEWHVTSLRTPTEYRFSAAARAQAVQMAARIPQAFGHSSHTLSLGPATVPTNYAVTSSMQSLLNTPSLDVLAAHDIITRQYGQLPGTGEIITNVSVGDLDDASESASGDACEYFVQGEGPTTIVSGGQRYLDWPSMPLIPTYTADSNGNVNGLGEVCGVDPSLGEVGLDFSMMAPLPHASQRMSNPGSGPTDLLGIAPGASYRLVVPASFNPTVADIDAALLAAGQQNPRPNVITASLGFGEDPYGFPGRYLEDDPLTESIVASLVQSGIVVCIATNDGIRTAYTTTAVAPSGGSAPTNLITDGATTLNDVAFSTVPSQDPDSGAIAVGATTLDDIFASPPGFSSHPAQHAYTDTRWTGARNFSSGFGTRVNLSAPGDNVISFEHLGNTAQSVDVVINGGTSASAPEVAAAAAVVLQVARLTGHPFTSPSAVRSFLATNGTAVPAVPQSSDPTNNVGPQVDLGRAVSTLFANAKLTIAPSVARVAVEQRRNADYGFGFPIDLDGVFKSDTDPTNIDLAGPVVSPTDSTLTAADRLAWITIAPDWEGLPSGATFKLSIPHTGAVMATTPWARLIPNDIMQAAGLPLLSSSTRVVTFTYAAYNGSHVVASTTIPLTFGPLNANPLELLAPQVPAVETGSSIPVTYDLSHVADLSNPTLIVSRPGRVDPVTGLVFDPSYTVAISGTKGTINVPVSKLHGGGIYGIGIRWGTYNGQPLNSDFAFVRVAPTSTSRPSAPLVSANGSTPGHNLEVPYGTPFQVSWDVTNVSKASGAMLEISAMGPGFDDSWNPFNNPNGNVRDADGIDSGSIYFVSVPAHGSTTINPLTVGMTPGFHHVVRVLPVSGSTSVGEASNVSTVVEDGVVAADGGIITGFGVNQNGTDGYLTSSASGASSLEVFNQAKKTITQTVLSSTTDVFSGNWDIFGSDITIFNRAFPDQTFSQFFLNPTATGTVGQQLTLPAGVPNLANAAENQSSTNEALTATFQNTYDFVTLNMLSGALSVFNESTTIPNFDGAVVEDPATNTAYVDASNTDDCTAPPEFASVNMATGAAGATSIGGIGNGPGGGLAYDPGLGILTLLPTCRSSVALYNVKTKTVVSVPVPSTPLPTNFSWLTLPVVDQVNHLVLVLNLLPPDAYTNNNSNISVVVINEKTGSIVKTIENFGYGGNLNNYPQPYFLVNGARREGWIIGNNFQLTPFSY